jgi:tetratricopeptide (TPR) repeat protein
MATRTTSPTADEYARTVSSIASAITRGDIQRAYEVADWAVRQGMTGRIIHNARGFGLQTSGRHIEALEDFHKALEAAPNDVATLNAIGLSELALKRLGKAQKAFEDALSADANSALTHYRLGLVLTQLGDHKRAAECHQRALELRPFFPDASAALASIAARTKKPAEARRLAEQTLAADPSDPMANHALVVMDMDEKQFEDAERRLRSMIGSGRLSPENRANLLSVLGDALEGMGRYGEAFETYRASNDHVRSQNLHRFEEERGSNTISYMTAYFEKADQLAWHRQDDGGHDPEAPAEHIFLMGFMRSGTTLLEQVLSSNAGVVALEEKSLLSELAQQYTTGVDALNALAAIEGADLQEAREKYWKAARAAAACDLSGKVFIDKQPLNTIKLPLISKLFPRAKVLFALRDPRDVVFSCYRRHFRVSTAMFEFLDLEDAARFYAGIMNLGDIYRRILPLNIMEHRYEDMVADFEGRIRAVCDFIGLDWSDSMRDFDKNAPNVDIRSPSAGQVQRPLYSEGVGQWRRYAEQLAPIRPILKPWIEKFGYSVE